MKSVLRSGYSACYKHGPREFVTQLLRRLQLFSSVQFAYLNNTIDFPCVINRDFQNNEPYISKKTYQAKQSWAKTSFFCLSWGWSRALTWIILLFPFSIWIKQPRAKWNDLPWPPYKLMAELEFDQIVSLVSLSLSNIFKQPITEKNICSLLWAHWK